MRTKYKWFGIASFVVLGAVGQSNAETIGHTVSMSAQVLASCSISGSASSSSTAFSNVTQQTSTFEVDVENSTALSTTGDLTIGAIACTGSGIKVTLTPSGWLKRPSGSGEITYSAYLKDGTTVLNSGNALVTSAGGTGPKFLNLTSTNINLGLRIMTNELTNAAAGTYSGTLEVSVDPI